MPLYCPSTTGMAKDTTCPRLLTILPLVLMIRIASSRTSGGTESSTIRGVLTPTITLPLASKLTRTTASTAKSIEPIIITLTTSHKLYIDNREISADNLSQEVQDIVRTTPRQAFVIRASKDVYYNEVIALLDMLKVNGAKYISVATDRK